MNPYIQYPDLLFTEDDHRYTWRGAERPSVTGVLGSVAVKNKKGEWVPIADNRFFSEDGGVTSAFGKSFHKAASYNLLGIDFDCPESLRPWYEQFKRWRKEYAFLRPLTDCNGIPLIEYPMYHEILGYAGTPDWVAEAVEPCPRIYRNAIVLPDWKTSTQEMAYWPAQTAGYAELVRHVFKTGPRRIIRMSVRFEADRFFPDTRINKPEDYAEFLSALNLYKKYAA